MRNYLKLLSLILILSAATVWYCADQPTKPTTEVSIKFEFVTGHTAQMRIGTPFIQSRAGQESINADSELKKTVGFQAIDQAMVMILDFSAYDSSNQYFDSEDYEEYVKTRDSWPGDLSQWAEWKKLLGDFFRIVVDQALNMESDRAKGAVSGVIGLNYILVALIEEGIIRYWGEGEVEAQEGETATAVISVHRAYYPGDVSVYPDSVTLQNGQTQQFYCYYLDPADTSWKDVTTQASWSTSPGTAGSISSTGLFTAHSSNTGTETVTATYQGEQDQATVTVIAFTVGEMAYIPAGEFTMGSDPGEGFSEEEPEHTVYLNAYWIGKYEITNAEYRRFDPNHHSTSDGDNFPVTEVSWYDALRFCNWLSQQEGLEPVYDESTWEANFSKNGYRLPTEAEWEKTARGGWDVNGGQTNPLSERTYLWGEGIDGSRANYENSGDPYDNGTTPVGYYDGVNPGTVDSPSPYGCYDIAGNVWEWCHDWYDGGYYSISPRNNPHGPDSGSLRIRRGGFDISQRCALCSGYDPGNRVIYGGFRVAGSVAP